MGVRFEQRIVEKDNPSVEVGKVKYEYVDDLSIDFEYSQIHPQIGLLPSLIAENGKPNIKPGLNKKHTPFLLCFYYF